MLGADPQDPLSITLATARAGRLCKVRHADGTVEDYSRAKTFDLATAHAPDLPALATLLRDLSGRRDTCVLRGGIRDPDHARSVRRLVHPDPETGEAPTLRDVPRAWIALDLDSLPLPAGTDPRDLPGCAEAALLALPAAFRTAGCIAFATSGHGFKPGARLRLWFMLSRPLAGAECKRWLRTAPVDRSVFGTAQPIYTAAPLFIGMHDPLPHRLVVVAGAPRVEVPELQEPPPARPTPHRLRPATWEAATARLAALIYAVRRAPDTQRHPTLFWAACRAGEMVAAGEVEGEAAARALAQAAMEGGGADAVRAALTALDGIARGSAEARR
jgi:hypothetical protein